MDKNGRKKIQIKYIEDKSRRHITFSKRKAGIMKKVRSSLSSQCVIVMTLLTFFLPSIGLRALDAYRNASLAASRL